MNVNEEWKLKAPTHMDTERKRVINLKKVLRWILLIWAILAIPYVSFTDFATGFFGLLYLGLIIGLMISDLRGKK